MSAGLLNQISNARAKSGKASLVIGIQAFIFLGISVLLTGDHAGILLLLILSPMEIIACLVGVFMGFVNTDEQKEIGRIAGWVNILWFVAAVFTVLYQAS